jgi:hypothetical protein
MNILLGSVRSYAAAPRNSSIPHVYVERMADGSYSVKGITVALVPGDAVTATKDGAAALPGGDTTMAGRESLTTWQKARVIYRFLRHVGVTAPRAFSSSAYYVVRMSVRGLWDVVTGPFGRPAGYALNNPQGRNSLRQDTSLLNEIDARLHSVHHALSARTMTVGQVEQSLKALMAAAVSLRSLTGQPDAQAATVTLVNALNALSKSQPNLTSHQLETFALSDGGINYWADQVSVSARAYLGARLKRTTQSADLANTNSRGAAIARVLKQSLPAAAQIVTTDEHVWVNAAGAYGDVNLAMTTDDFQMTVSRADDILAQRLAGLGLLVDKSRRGLTVYGLQVSADELTKLAVSALMAGLNRTQDGDDQRVLTMLARAAATNDAQARALAATIDQDGLSAPRGWVGHFQVRRKSGVAFLSKGNVPQYAVKVAL